jgi:hypothetical protein
MARSTIVVRIVPAAQVLPVDWRHGVRSVGTGQDAPHLLPRRRPCGVLRFGQPPEAFRRFFEVTGQQGVFSYPPLAVRRPDGSQVPLGRPVAPVTLYRGSFPERKRRMSWASEPSLAEELEARHAHFDAAALYKATIAPDAILAHLERRDEGWTVVVDPAGLTNSEKSADASKVTSVNHTRIAGNEALNRVHAGGQKW